MQEILTDTLAIVVACLAVAALAVVVILFKPMARRRRHGRRHGRRPKIDLFKPGQAAGPAEPDA
ncbi:MAG TPA: hypothetical protein VGA98_05405 [Allosphingosinicella sp.]|jgi:hypothetical protein